VTAKRRGRARRASRLALVLAAGACLAHASQALALDDAARRGRQIYFEGVSPRGSDIVAVVGDEAAELPGSVMPCASCHGADGLGRPEGGVSPVDIRWSELIKTYGHVHETGRRHPAFDAGSIARAIIAGVDPANNPLDRSMPLYQMSADDMADLLAYLKVLENDVDPGIDEHAVRVATLLPLSGSAGDTGQAMARVMEAYFSAVNAAGGIFGRRIELLAVPLAATPEASVGNLGSAFDTAGVFAVVGAWSIGLDEPLLEFLRGAGAPLVGPFTLDPGDAYIDSAAFYLFAGFDVQARVLADRALEQGGAPGQVVIVGPEEPRAERLVRAAEDQLRRRRGGDVAVERYAAGSLSASELAERIGEHQALVFLGPQQDLQAVLEELARRGRAPGVYVLSSLLSGPMNALPAEFERRICVAFPTLSSDITDKGRKEYQQLAETYSLSNEHMQAQLAALTAAKLFVEGLRRAGRSLSRERLVAGIEQLYTWQSGFTPPLSYGPNRRIGARGAHILVLDIAEQRYTPLGSGWYELQ